MDAQVKSVSHAFGIMRLLADGEARTLSEVARACSLSPSSCLGLLRTLVAERVLLMTAGKRYSLATAWREGAVRWADPQAQIIAEAQPLLDRLARRLDAPVGLWRVIPRDRLQLIALGESGAATRIHMQVGQRQPIGGGATGRALAAAQGIDAARLEARFSSVRWEQALDFGTYRQQVLDAVRAGYAVDDRYGHAGVRSIAVAMAHAAPPLCLSVSFFADAPRQQDAAVGAALIALTEQLAHA